MKSFIGYKVSEKEIRDWLSQNGYNGKSAKFAELELHALQRPGWLQIFRFTITLATAEIRKLQLFGAMHSDERFGPPKIFVFEDKAARDAQLDDWSRGLITHRQSRKIED